MSVVDIQPAPRTATRTVVLRRLGLALLLALVLALAVKGWLIYNRAQALRADVRALQSQARAPLDQAAAAQLGPLLAKTRADTAALRAEAALFLPITPWLGWVPRYGGELAAAGPLLDAGVDLSAAADDAFTVFGPLLPAPGAAPLDGARLRERITSAGPQFEQARAALARAAHTWMQIDFATLQPATAEPLRRIDQALPLVRLALEVAPTLPALLDDMQALRPYAGGQPGAEQLAALGPLLAKARADTAALRVAAAPLVQPAAGQPAPAADLAAAAPLIDAAAELAAAADQAYAGLAPILQQRDAAQPLGVALATQLQAAQPQLRAAQEAAVRAADAVARLEVARLPAPLAERIAPLSTLANTLRDGMNLALALPDLLGTQGPAEYLLLAQNPDELRATGGFIGSAGVMSIQNGQIGGLDLRYSRDIDDIANQPYPDPPAPLLRYMAIELWLFRDANWSLDFPTAAQHARKLYAIGQGHEPANVVAFDPYAVQMMLEATGPVQVEGIAEPVSAQNVWDYLRNEHDQQQGQQNPKEYIGRLANALLAQVNSGAARPNIWRLGLALRRALRERHLLLDVASPQARALFARYGWDGGVRPGSADFLMLADTSMGYNKMDAKVTRTIDYAVDLAKPQAPQATLTLRYTNPVQSADPCIQFVEGDNFYSAWMQRCYYDYVRVLAPHNTSLLDASTQPVPGEWMTSGENDDGVVQDSPGVADTTELATFQVVPFNATRDTVLTYALPAAVLTRDAQNWHYRLRIQKQAGTQAVPFTVEITMPSGAKLISAGAGMAGQSGQVVRFAGTLATDQTIDLVFSAP